MVSKHSLRAILLPVENGKTNFQEGANSMNGRTERVNNFTLDSTCDAEETVVSFTRRPRKTYEVHELQLLDVQKLAIKKLK